MPEPSIRATLRPRYPVRFALVLAAAAIAVLAGCGRKLPPIQPGTYPPPAVRDLAFQVRGEEVVLSWTVPAGAPDKDSPAVGFKVLRSRQTEQEVAECQSCAPRFQAVGDVRPMDPVESGAMQYVERLEPGYRYQYKVRSYSASNREGRDSNVVHLTP
jgi:hypothetical protein